MECLYPQGTYRMDKSLAFRPCGQCLSCRINYSREWAIRCVHESMMHEENSYLTLTYNNKYLPKDKSVHKKELQSFMKRLRRKLKDKKVRFFGCGEYGDQKSRPHYHLCLFGHQFKDLEIYKQDPNRYKPFWKKGHDHTLYTSKTLQDDIWKKGYCYIGDLTFESAAYVARYVVKKITGSSKEAIKMRNELYGERNLEFALMSRMPGIGKPFFDKFHGDIYPKDFVTHKGKKFRPPRYYDSLYAKMDPHKFAELKKKRIEENEIDLPEVRDVWSKEASRQAINKTFTRGDL
jgi:hypothetical protein